MLLLDKFVGSHLADILLNEELKVSRWDELNDPFEGHHKIESYTPQQALSFVSKWRNHVSQHAGRLIDSEDFNLETPCGAMSFLESRKDFLISTAIEAANLSFRIACFTNHKKQKTEELALREVLMWAHYANSQKGARIVFDPLHKSLPGGLIQVKYDTAPPELPLDAIFSGSNTKTRPPLNAFNTKSKAWEYEDELRLFVETKKVKRDHRDEQLFEFVQFPIEAVKIVDFGIYHPQEERDSLIRKLKSGDGSHIRFRQCARKHNRYEFNFEPIA